jgi:hypothetical protein
MFSSTTIELSTSMPTAKEMPARLTTLMLRSSSQRKRKVPTADTGMARAVMRVPRKLRKNRNSTNDGKQAAFEDIVLDDADGLENIGRLVVVPLQVQIVLGQHFAVEMVHHRPDVIDQFQHIGAGLAPDHDDDAVRSAVEDRKQLVFMAQPDWSAISRKKMRWCRPRR